ncbi:HWE histidine kinase domain-containing protein [uncultured Aureimonas sp.]|uniref:sensor histidine kinase n=1 Tax=uncultured Aureimonas sp. TaxID=1604662 RepID=UPI0025E0225F|nr:HWE histidine kinase domain-containing protein [uncultured Aureimonas sp.]
MSSGGQALGAFRVIDTLPRPAGLTDRQSAVLRHLARQVVTEIEMRQLLGERDALVERLRQTSAQSKRGHETLASLFDHTPSFMALQRGPDHVFELVNAAHRQAEGGRDVIGLGVRDALPDAVDQGYADILDEIFATEVPRTMRASPWSPQPDPAVPGVQNYLDIHYQLIVEDGAVVGIFTVGHDVTAHVDQLRRQTALAELGEHLRTLTDTHAVAMAASEVMARTLGATRAGIGTVDPEAETVMMHENWRRNGAVAIEGLFRFRDYGTYIEDLKAGEIVVIEDVTTDPRTMANAEAIVSLGIRVLLNFPVIKRGRFVMVAFVHFEDLHPLSPEDILFVRQVADRTQAALARIRQDEQQRVLHLELAHRMKNTLAVVKAITSQTLRQAESVDAGRMAIDARLGALARAQDILTASSTFEEADAADVIRAAISPHDDRTGRILLDGPHLRLSSQQAIGLSLAIHELATNAVKYGALSNAAGRTSVRWGADGGRFWFQWVEAGGPPVAAPRRRGFGSKLLERVIAANFEASAHLDYAPDGVRFTLGTVATCLERPDA